LQLEEVPVNAEVRLYVQIDGETDEAIGAGAAAIAEAVCEVVAESHGIRAEGDVVRAFVVVRPVEFEGEGDAAFLLHALDGSAGSYIVVHPDTSASELGMVEG
jgi:hypothetical protein